MELAVRQHGSVTVVQPLAERIDAMVAVMFKDRMKAAIEAGSSCILLDLSPIGFLDSSGLGAVVAIRRFLREGQRLELASLTPPVQRVFRLTRMDSVFTIHSEVDDALRIAAA
jgi:anti-sigma B factor antagonist